MSISGIRIKSWAKRSKHGIPIPLCCPDCESRKTVLSFYGSKDKGFDLSIACDGCYTIISNVTTDGEINPEWKTYRKCIVKELRRMENE